MGEEKVYISVFDKTSGKRKTSYTILGNLHGKTLDELKKKAAADFPDDYAVEQTAEEHKRVITGDLCWNGTEYTDPPAPSEEEVKKAEAEKEADTAKTELREIAITAMMSQLAGGDLTESKASYQTALMSVSDEAAILIPDVFPSWSGAGVAYKTGDRVMYNGTMYKVLQDHTSQEGWTPEAAPSLFAKVLTSTTGEPLPWEQPGSTNPYMTGDRVTYNGKIYESTIDNNVWAPDAYPAGWKEITE